MDKTLSTASSYFQKFLMLDGVLYINGISYKKSGNTLFKLKKGTNDYWSAIDTSAPDYSGILTLPAGLSPYSVCFKNYGDKYIMFIDRRSDTDQQNRIYASGYIFSNLNNIANTIEDCIPSVRYTDIVFKNTSVGGILSLGMNRDATAGGLTDCVFNSYLYTTIDEESKTADLTSQALFFNIEGNWTNLVSIAVLSGESIIEKGATDVLYVTYGYKIN